MTSSGGAAYPCCVVGGMTRDARHGYHPNNSTSTCVPSLAFLASRLHLFTYLLADDYLKLGHFLRHYHTRLGVWPNHTRIALRMRASAGEALLNATLAVAAAAGVPHANVRQVHASPSDAVKIALINEQLCAPDALDPTKPVPGNLRLSRCLHTASPRCAHGVRCVVAGIASLACRHSLEPHKWFVYADADEHFDYPCELRRALSRADVPRGECVRGFLFDQLAADGNISAMADAPSLVEQYPLQCNVHGLSPRIMNSKTILVRAGGGGGLNRTTREPLHRMSYRSVHPCAKLSFLLPSRSTCRAQATATSNVPQVDACGSWRGELRRVLPRRPRSHPALHHDRAEYAIDVAEGDPAACAASGQRLVAGCAVHAMWINRHAFRALPRL